MAGEFTSLGSAFGPVGTGVGVAADLGVAIAGAKGEQESIDEEKRRFGMSSAISLKQIRLEEERIRKKEQERERFRQALSKFSQRGA